METFDVLILFKFSMFFLTFDVLIFVVLTLSQINLLMKEVILSTNTYSRVGVKRYNFRRSKQEIEIIVFVSVTNLQNWSGDRKSPRGSLFQVFFSLTFSFTSLIKSRRLGGSQLWAWLELSISTSLEFTSRASNEYSKQPHLNVLLVASNVFWGFLVFQVPTKSAASRLGARSTTRASTTTRRRNNTWPRVTTCHSE